MRVSEESSQGQRGVAVGGEGTRRVRGEGGGGEGGGGKGGGEGGGGEGGGGEYI